jgi:hypothetical protein
MILSYSDYINENYSINNIIEEEGRILFSVGSFNYFKDEHEMNDPWATSHLKNSIEEVPIQKIKVSQRVSLDKLKKMGAYKKPSYSKYDTHHPVAIKYKRDIILLDGHHRLELAKKAGEKFIEIAIKDVTDKYS